MASLSILVRFRNHADTLRAVLAALPPQDPNVELVGVDSGSTDGSADLVRQQHGIVVNLEPAHFTYGRALNEGVAACSGSNVILLSAHSVPVSAAALTRLVAPLERADIAGSFGRQLPGPRLDPFEAATLDKRYGPTSATSRHDPSFSNAWSAIKRSVWLFHRFNEIVPGSEDQRWAHEVQREGHVIAYVAEAEAVYHQHLGARGLYRRMLRSAFAGHCLRRGRPPKLHQVAWSAVQYMSRDLDRCRRGFLPLPWLARSPAYRAAQALATWRGARLAALLLD